MSSVPACETVWRGEPDHPTRLLKPGYYSIILLKAFEIFLLLKNGI